MAQTVQHMPDQAPDKSKPYCLMNSDGSTADWFATHDAAVAAMRKTSQAGRHMYSEDQMFSLTPVGVEFAEADGVWIEALQAKDYHTDKYDKVSITTDKLTRLAESVKNKTRGIDLSTDYEHGFDLAKGNKASGTINDAKVDGDKLLLNVAFTDTAKAEIRAGEWKYFSSDWLDEYTHDDGTKHVDVLRGGGLTNKPVAKGLNPLPINFSELYDEVKPNQMSEDGMNELLKKLATQLGIQFSETDKDEDVEPKVFAELTSVQKSVTDLTAEVEPLRTLKETANNQKTFAEQYPEQHKQMQEDREFRQDETSRRFAETIGSKRFSENVGEKDSKGNDVVVTTTKGLSALALDQIRSTHKKFSEQTATAEDFTKTIDTILDGGIVDYGEVGTTGGGAPVLVTGEDVVPSGDVATVRMAFAEKVTEVQAELQAKPENKDKAITFSDALPVAAEKYKKMYDAYMGQGASA